MIDHEPGCDQRHNQRQRCNVAYATLTPVERTVAVVRAPTQIRTGAHSHAAVYREAAEGEVLRVWAVGGRFVELDLGLAGRAYIDGSCVELMWDDAHSDEPQSNGRAAEPEYPRDELLRFDTSILKSPDLGASVMYRARAGEVVTVVGFDDRFAEVRTGLGRGFVRGAAIGLDEIDDDHDVPMLAVASATTDGRAQFCNGCGVPLPADAAFCHQCGRAVTTPTQQRATAQATQAPTALVPRTATAVAPATPAVQLPGNFRLRVEAFVLDEPRAGARVQRRAPAGEWFRVTERRGGFAGNPFGWVRADAVGLQSAPPPPRAAVTRLDGVPRTEHPDGCANAGAIVVLVLVVLIGFAIMLIGLFAMPVVHCGPLEMKVVDFNNDFKFAAFRLCGDFGGDQRPSSGFWTALAGAATAVGAGSLAWYLSRRTH